MLYALVFSLLAGQTLYEWVDARGTSHFTDDPSTIPANAKRKVTTGADLMVTPAAPKLDAGAAAAAPPRPDLCAAAQLAVKEAERQLEQDKVDRSLAEERANQHCQDVLRGGGQASFARCMAGRASAVPPSTGSTEKRLDDAREMLRRVQVNGCR